MQFGDFKLYEFLLSMAALIISITVHEFAHAFSAYRAGDDTPRAQGRISLNPLDHLDPMGTLMMVVTSVSHMGIGWGRPVQVNPANFNHPRWDNLRVSLWGPLSNIVLAGLVGISLRIWGMSLDQGALRFLVTLCFVNLGLAMFNLIPIAPLDGSHILSCLLPYEAARKYDFFMARNGMFVFLALIFMGGSILPLVLGPPTDLLWGLFTGPNGNNILVRTFFGAR